ncbi:uncharacterized protein EDB93DRAFT_1238018 [Suillus bovinus]|uniref:uncharacterized protein n=1 Tax=Suillus bovinus TaxID=48563 RepID=UPI001B880E2B|nr:uncharacterized protein EDB93DRAFT_1238018 [Suillus bovinus]KAG2158227.1 hypothetical protein EDB93DRAFT_1238018 [Suillus bovinus]
MALQRTSTPQDPSETSRQVNNILRNLRGEHFRHSRNVQRVPASLPTSLHVNNLPTLPISLIYPSPEDGKRNAAPPSGHHSTRSVRVAGPDPPRSWTTLSSPRIREGDLAGVNFPAWREHALDLVFSFDNAVRTGEFPTLALLCLHVIRMECSGSELAEIRPYIPPHLRRVLMRHSAINCPLSLMELNAICGEDRHADGELVVVGPHATLCSDHFRRIHSSRESMPGGCTAVEDTWDSLATEGSEPSTLFCLTLLSTSVTFGLSDLPPTITCLSLINITFKPASFQRLPSYCPLVSLLDLSYNNWLVPASGEKLLQDYPWAKLRLLENLGVTRVLYYIVTSVASQ